MGKNLFVDCKDCKDRKVGCHSVCEKYIQAKKAHLKRSELIVNGRHIDEDLQHVQKQRGRW